ncbi:MAG: DUF1934 domain-containing protein [Clostridiales bacterium]|nr:DUF1934 domain-containing protein [Candidatus Cacconaster stercorequi]
MEGQVTVKVESRSCFGGVNDVIHFEGSGMLEKTDYGWHLRYDAVNKEDGKSAIASDIKLEKEMNRAVVINESAEGGYGLLLDPKRATATQIQAGEGVMNLNVSTREVKWDLGAKKRGTINLQYALLVGLQPLSVLNLTVILEKD